MVDNSMVGTTHTHGITCVLAIDTQSTFEADMTCDDIRADIDIGCFDTDTLAWCCLSGDIGIGLGEIRLEVEFDDTTDIKHDITRLVDIHQTIKQRAWSVFVTAEVSDMIDDTAASTLCVASIALRLREGKLTGAERPYQSFMYRSITLHLVDTPIVIVL